MITKLYMLYAFQFIGIPYKFGGNNQFEGLDCSGFVQEVLRSAGVKSGRDKTAQGLFLHFGDTSRFKASIHEGDLLFFGVDYTSISHVALAINENTMIESGGVDSEAMVRVRPIRKDLLAVIDPE